MPAEEKPAEEKPAEVMPAEEKPAEEKPAEEKPAEKAPVEKAAEDKPAEDKPAEEKPAPASPAEAATLPEVPAGLPPVPVPDDNPMTAEKVALGKMLYFDKRLSSDGTVSCATCHDPKMAWAEHTPTSTGIGKQVGGRNAPTVINAAYATSQFWDGRAPSLEAQALGPVENPIEMGHKMEAVLAAFAKIPEYQKRFQEVFGREINREDFGRAIAAFERTVLSGNSPYDKFKAGDQGALNEAQKRGMQTFEDAGCSGCHAPPLFSNYRFYNAGVGMDKEKPDPGRKEVTGRDRDLGAFRVPALREVAGTHPYFHDGSAATLEDAVALMAEGGKDNPNLSPMLKAVRSAGLTKEDQQDLVEFLKALSGEYPVTEPPPLPEGP
jgi:cytochrome c peroxidase